MASATRPASAAVLERTGFKRVCEWLTAEVLAAEPDDPIAFVRDLAAKAVSGRPAGSGFRVTEPDALFEQTMQAVSSGQATQGQSIKLGTEIGETGAHAAGQDRAALLQRVLDSSRRIAAELDPNAAVRVIIAEACALLHCERATVWLAVDRQRQGVGASHEGQSQGATETRELVMVQGTAAPQAAGSAAAATSGGSSSAGESAPRLKWGSGIAGAVAASGEALVIPDARQDPRFDSATDEKMGFHTRAVVALPVLDADEEVVGVLQAVNRRGGNRPDGVWDGTFGSSDVQALQVLAQQAGVALRNAQVHARAQASERRAQAMLDVVRALQAPDLGAPSLMFQLSSKAPLLVGADRCTFYLADHEHGELWAVQGDVDLRVPIDKGIAGLAAQSGKPVRIDDVYTDERWSGLDVDRKTGYRTRALLTMPVVSPASSTLVGVMQLINKVQGPTGGPGSAAGAAGALGSGSGGSSDGRSFTTEDEQVMQSFLALVAPLVERSPLFQQRLRKGAGKARGGAGVEGQQSEFSGAKLGHEQAQQELAAVAAAAGSAIPEGEEEEEEEEEEDEADEGQ